MISALLFVVVSFFCRSVIAGFGVTQAANAVRVETGAGLTFEVNKNNGDITSLLFKGTQYQATTKGTHINSGLGESSVSTKNVGSDYIVTTIKSKSNPVTQYYVAKKGESRIYIATYTTGEVQPGELRFIARLRKALVPNGVKHPVADSAGGVPIEGKDVFKVGDETRCKFFSAERFIDDGNHTVHGSGVYISLIMPDGAYETTSGGPFMRDINNQGTNDHQEFYFYMNSGHLRTEKWRHGLKGPYVLDFSTSAPKISKVDTSFFAKLDISGYVPASGRGFVSGLASGVPSRFPTVLHWRNDKHQYWVYAAEGGKFKSPAMKPGTYEMIMYKQEYPVANTSVSVTVGSVTTKDIASTESTATPVWRVGQFDGQPFEFKNGDKFLTMHPSDKRMSKWGGSYTVGASTTKDFPMALFAKIGGNATIHFNLTSTQASAPMTLRVGTTLSFKGGRPVPRIGSWTSIPPVPTNLNSRGVTRGGYRGFGEVYEFKIPTKTLKAGKNTLYLGVGGGGDVDFLSANYIIDAVEMVRTASITSVKRAYLRVAVNN
ncbi:polysaccharide lyase family 4 protein [Venturia nashicola]|uniref:rhamnogalacturonan endolyase n=1 Tax=Venturia nashicola TaxID=86259 RepID=A0A4Z1PFC0_9PEZI|nr:polysaccharide lyase family 4 protein [Venturia nashicola]TLD34710.1 polysaccharide lyase family 4 protein [Venturia nashicola]